jgi:hypothetical protein
MTAPNHRAALAVLVSTDTESHTQTGDTRRIRGTHGRTIVVTLLASAAALSLGPFTGAVEGATAIGLAHFTFDDGTLRTVSSARRASGTRWRPATSKSRIGRPFAQFTRRD